MKTYDCFTFFNELDLLEIRLHELDQVVDYFVLVEGARTFQNNPKPFYFLENSQRFEKFAHRIIRVEVPESQYTTNAWANEDTSFQHILKGLTAAQPEDIVLLSALDEVPSKQAIRHIQQVRDFPCCVSMDFFYFYLNTKYWLNNPNDLSWPGTYATTFECLDKTRIGSFVQQRKNVTKVQGGWHFSFLGDAESAWKKSNSYSHAENNHFTKEFYMERIANLEDVFGRSDVGFHSFVELSTLPSFILDNMDRFKKYIRQ